MNSSTSSKCACPCGCDAGAPRVGLPFLDGKARCTDCVRQHAHLSGEGAQGSVWERIFSSSAGEEIEQDVRERVLNHDRQVWEERTNSWCEKLPVKFRGADRMSDPLLAASVEHMREGRPGMAGFVVSGGAGTGKTWLAMSYVKLLVQERLVDPGEVLVGSESELLVSLTQQAQWDVGAALAKLVNPRWKVVFIDDVGVGLWRSEQARLGAWHPIIDAMYAEDRTIVLSTALSPVALQSHLGASVFSRIRSMADERIISLTTDERRGRDSQRSPNP